MPPPKKRVKLSREEILEKKRESERLRRERIKNDPVKLAEQQEKERLKYLKKKEKGQRKIISQMTEREKRKTRKKWKESSKHYREKLKTEKNATNFIQQATPPPSDVEDLQEHRRPIYIENRRIQEARNRSQRQRRLRNKQIKHRDRVIAKLKKKLKTQQQKYRRLKGKRKAKPKPIELTPKTRCEQLADDITERRELVKKAIFGEVLKTQLEENCAKIKNHKEKAVYRKIISGKLVNKYKLWRHKNKAITYKKTGHNLTKTKKTNKKTRKQKMVEEFLEDDAFSRQAAGKKEYITRKSERKQKRYLLDTLRNLHLKFLKVTDFKMSYSLFCRFRPFWIVPPKLQDRDTCACIMHANIDLKLAALKNAKILSTIGNYQNMLEELCCDRYYESCLERTCDNCRLKQLPYEEFDNSKMVLLKQWINKKEKITDPKTKKERFIRKYKIELKEIPPRDLILNLEEYILPFFRHECNIVHQYNTIKNLKQSLTEKDAIIHMDFSENFATKYNQEIQAFHFGGSRNQISLHTVVLYLKDSTTSHCTMSSNLSHNVGAIWAHLRPVLESLPQSVENIHFLSDGPVTQYRNKTMFYVLACRLKEMLSRIQNFSWNYHEAGHGKGAPDGVGATCKRAADQVIAAGGDISNLNEFCKVVRERCPAINTVVIEDQEIDDTDKLLNENASDQVPFRGTLLVHQVTGSAFLPNRLTLKSLSCFCNSDGCNHYKLGSIQYKSRYLLNISDVYSDSEDETSRFENRNVSPVPQDVPKTPGPGNLEMNSVRVLENNNSVSAGPGISDILKTRLENGYGVGDYLLIRYKVRKTEYRYVGVCDSLDEDDGELRVTFLKVCNKEGTLFKYDETDVSDVLPTQIIKKLPVPNLSVKGNRVFYSFNEQIDVFEK